MEQKKNSQSRAAYLRSRQLEKWVKVYVDKMAQFPAPKYKKGGK